ncbi:gliding motility-associated peptidyl-prolyl isomerase GldI [Antarcticibacterium sp. 1MA-6-2]|uniref:gliding motility-associated peptidyl-prolyl isomerase GldI n=1 Tax=Antarcticibacterium sp. 1MA-6-2 TaxID=2908210 RepID=UPI0028833285|nr:gliding motility-associated peptidyl-prolyl isomerase GldI [Antarcticibacterium sp. 1MA-6-2]
MTQSSGSFINESIERNRELVAREEAEILELIEKDSSNLYTASNNGFWYFYNKKSTDSTNTETPEFGDVVLFDYNITDIDGNVIYAEGEIPTRRYAMDKEELFGGLREGLKLMKEGEIITFIFPSHKAFGYYGDKNKIGTNIPIITRVHLHSITDESNINPN